MSDVGELKAIVLQESHWCCSNAFFWLSEDQWIITLVTQLCQKSKQPYTFNVLTEILPEIDFTDSFAL